MSAEQDPVTKLPKLNNSKDYIHWRRRVHAYLRRNDFELLGLTEETPGASAAVQKKWMEAMIKAKSAIVLSLGSAPLAQLSTIIDDDDRSAKELWDGLATLYTTSNAQAILNLENELESLCFKDGENWEAHMEKFHDTLGKLSAYDSPVKQEDKASKLLRTLPESFAPLAMVAQTSDLSLEKLVVAVEGEISRRLNKKNQEKRSNLVPQANFAGRGTKSGTSAFHQGNINKKKNVKCFVCGKHGHYANECWYKNTGAGYSSWRGRGRSRGGNFYRGRGRGRGYRYGQENDPRAHHGHGYSMPHHGHGYSMPHHMQPNPRTHIPQPYPDTAGPGHPQAQANAHNGQQLEQPNLHGNQQNGPNFFGFMAQIKFRSSVATCGNRKLHVALIDSGGTHHFFFNKSSFVNYQELKTEQVTSASGSSVIVGKGTVFIPLDGGMFVEAYHAPHFSTNILSVGKLSEFFDILFSSYHPALNGVSTCFMIRRQSKHVVYKTEIENGLYPLDLNNEYAANIAASTTFVNQSSSHTEMDVALEWHNRTGHPSVTRYLRLANILENVPLFPMDILRNLFCIPCSIAKAKRAAIPNSPRITQSPLELVHVDIQGPISPPSLSGCRYALGIVDDRSAKSDVYFLKEKREIANQLVVYQARSERVTGFLLQNIRLDGAGENRSTIIENHAKFVGIQLEYSPPYAPQSNGVAERFMQELSLRSRVLLAGCKLDKTLWAEAMNHGNWLRNRLPSERVMGNLPILEWKPSTRISFQNVLTFGQPGFAFRYTSSTAPQKKFSARSVFGHFVGMHSDETLFRVYVPELSNVILVRHSDFRPVDNSRLPGVDALIDGLSHQSLLDSEEQEDGAAEEGLQQALNAEAIPILQSFASKKRNIFDARLPKSFQEAVKHKEWRDAIDREYNALLARQVWKYVIRTPSMNPLPYTWVFRLKPLDEFGKECLHKARCCVRGDLQDPRFDFDPNGLYAPVASHEAVRLLLAIAASEDLIVEGGDVSNAYLYGKIDFPVIMEQPTNSSCKEAQPGYVCELLRSMYGLRQAGKIWGSLMGRTLIGWGFHRSVIDPRVYFKVIGKDFLIVVIVVDDLNFASNSKKLMDQFKLQLKARFDVKLFGRLRSFVGWEILHKQDGIILSQSRYVKELLEKHFMTNANAVWTPFPLQACTGPLEQDEVVLNRDAHSKFRTFIGELLYLAVCSRPDISYAVCALARNVHAPTLRHVALMKRVLRYLAGTSQFGIMYHRHCSQGNQGLQAYSDSDWAGCRVSRQSTTGFVVTFNGSPISWKSVKQTVVALSSAEAEYIAMSTCAKELTWIRRLTWEMLNRVPYSESCTIPPTLLYVDNTAALTMAHQQQISSKSKHVEVKYHHVRSLVEAGTIGVEHVGTVHQVADILTKEVDFKTLERHRQKLLVDKSTYQC